MIILNVFDSSTALLNSFTMFAIASYRIISLCILKKFYY